MYKIIRPLLFVIDPEKIHYLTLSLLRFFQSIRVLKLVFKKQRKPFYIPEWDITFPNRVGLAAGLDKNASAITAFSQLGFGFIEIGTVTPRSQHGNSKPRLFRLPKDFALINRMGFNNEGVKRVSQRLKQHDNHIIIGGNIGKNTTTENTEALTDYRYTFEVLYPLVDYIVVNVSCPNIKDLSELQDSGHLKQILNTLLQDRKTKNSFKPVLLKVSPDLSHKQLDETIDIVKQTGADGFVATNTTKNRENLDYSNEYLGKIGNGGLSGKPLRHLSTQVIQYIYNKTHGKYPIIGVGGIFSAEDAAEKIKAGASVIQIYSGLIYKGPQLIKDIHNRISKEVSIQ